MPGQARVLAAGVTDVGRKRTHNEDYMAYDDSVGLYKHIADMVATIMGRPAGDVVLVVGHSNTIAKIVGALGGPKIPDLCDSQYSTMFILEMNGGKSPRLIRATYGKEDPPDPICRNRKAP